MYNVTVNGKRHRSLAEACRVTNIKISTIRYWLGLGFSNEEAFEQVLKMTDERKVTAFGETYPTMSDCCNTHNKHMSTIRSRLEKGKTLEQALEVTIRSYER